jgi:hypothetical protein
MKIILILEKLNGEFIFHNTRLETQVPIDTVVSASLEQTVYDFVSSNSDSGLLGDYSSIDGMYEVEVNASFIYTWDATNKTLLLTKINTDIFLLTKID